MSKKESDVIKKEIINLKKITYEDVAEAFSESLPELIIFLKKKIKEKENPKEKEVIKKKYSKIANLTYTGELNEIKNHFESIIKQNKNYEKTQIMNIKTSNDVHVIRIDFGKRTKYNPNSKFLSITNCKLINIGEKIKKSNEWLDINTKKILCGNSVNFQNFETIDQCCKIDFVDRLLEGKGELDDFCFQIFKECQNFIKLNESALVTVLARFFLDNNYKIGVNVSFPEIFNGITYNFEPDLIIITSSILIVFEAKYRNDRFREQENAIMCLKYKQYGQRLLNTKNFNQPMIALWVLLLCLMVWKLLWKSMTQIY